VDRRIVAKVNLLERLPGLVREILPDGKQVGHEWVGYAADGRKWSVHMRDGPKRGVASVWSDGLHGDIVGLVVDGHCGGDFVAAMDWIWRWCGIGGAELTPADLRRQREHAARVRREQERVNAEHEARRLAAAVGLWGLPGDHRIARAYLASRGLAGAPARYLRCAAAAPYDREALPAMVAPVVSLQTAELIGVHLTFVERNADGVWKKLKRPKAKQCRGPVSGGVAPLSDGAGAPWPQWLSDPNRKVEALVAAEGIENALSAALAFPGCRTCAFLSVSFLEAMAHALPRQADPIILVADRDGSSGGAAGIRRQRATAIALWLSQGRTVHLYAAPHDAKDANKWLEVLVCDHGYQPRFFSLPPTLDFHTVLAEAKPATAGDPVALWWQSVTGAGWGDGNEPPLLIHPTLVTIERPEVSLPAAVLPVMGELGEPVGAAVAWLTPDGELAPLMLSIRIIGDSRGVIVLRKAKRSRVARLVVDLPSALVAARLLSCTVLAAIDAPHAALCAPGVPHDVDVCDLWTNNEDMTLAGEPFAAIAREQLNAFDLTGNLVRPWDGFIDFGAMLRDRDVAHYLGR
jgi:hypothetical protein